MKNDEIEIKIFQDSKSYLQYRAFDLETEMPIYSFDYHIDWNGGSEWKEGNFLFEMEEVLEIYNFTNQEELLNYCKSLINEKNNARTNWKRILKDFEQHNISVSPNESDGGYIGNSNNWFMTNI